jgi:lysophospholipase L1-like esterase
VTSDTLAIASRNRRAQSYALAIAWARGADTIARTLTPTSPHLGVLAFGDSITNAGGELQWGVALHSWALWTARALGLPYTGYAVDGATVDGVLRDQIPGFLARAADPDGPYDLGCLYIGVNDVRRPGFALDAFSVGHAEAMAFLTARCTRVLTVTAPLRLGRPRAQGVKEMDAAIRANAVSSGALVLDLGAFGARNQVMVDHVHPTAFGQVAIAQRALAVLAADGAAVRVDPATLIAPDERSRLRAAQADWTYVYRDLTQRGRAARGRVALRRVAAARGGR